MGGRGQGIHVLRGQGGSGSKWKPNISVPAVSPQHPPHPHPGRATFPWNDANGVIRVSVSKIKSVTPFCRLIISTFQAARRQHNTRRGGCFLSRLTQIYSCVCVCVCVCVRARMHACGHVLACDYGLKGLMNYGQTFCFQQSQCQCLNSLQKFDCPETAPVFWICFLVAL